jgi:hypothetical protein
LLSSLGGEEEEETEHSGLKGWISRRQNYGACASLVNELQVQDPMQLRTLLRLLAVDIENLVGWSGPFVQKQDTTRETVGDNAIPSYWWSL